MPLPVRELICVLGLAVVLSAAAAPARPAADEAKGKAMAQRTITQALKDETPKLMKIPGVVGTAQGLCAGKPCIKVYVKRKTPELLRRIPSAIEGHAVSVEETGEIRALDPS